MKGGAARQLQTLFDAGAIGSLTDAELLGRFLRLGPLTEPAFEALVDRHGRMVLRVCLDVLGDSHEAQDAAQATFFILARKAGSIRNPDALASWLHGTARRVATRALRESIRRRHHERKSLEIPKTNPTEPEAPRNWAELHEELAKLPDRYRDPIILCDLTGLTHEQAAGQLGCPPRTLQTRLYRGRERLKQKLIRRGVAPSAALVGLSWSASARAALPGGWVGSTAETAVGLAKSGGWVAAGKGSVVAMGLARGTLKEMVMAKLKLKLIAVVGVLIGAVTTGAWSQGPPRGQQPAPKALPKLEALEIPLPKDEFERTYSLAKGEDVKIFQDQAIAARYEHYRGKNQEIGLSADFNLGDQNPMTLFFRWQGDKTKWRCTMSAAAPLRDILGTVLNRSRQEFEGDDVLLQTIIPADILVRDGAPDERIIPQLETILRRDFHLPIRIVSRMERRDSLVVRGRYTFQADPGLVPFMNISAGDQIEVYAREIAGPRSNPFAVGGGTYSGFLSDLAMFIGLRLVDESENPPTSQMSWRVSGYQFFVKIPVEDRTPTLAHVSQQTGLTFHEEQREVRVLHVDRDK
jgi:RNA polymerase sigma factor (sigma-70 family)